MTITGRAINPPRKEVVSPCGFIGMAGYKEDGVEGADAQLSFMPKTNKVTTKVTSVVVEDRTAKVVKATLSEYIPGMWTFLIKYQE